MVFKCLSRDEDKGVQLVAARSLENMASVDGAHQESLRRPDVMLMLWRVLFYANTGGLRRACAATMLHIAYADSSLFQHVLDKAGVASVVDLFQDANPRVTQAVLSCCLLCFSEAQPQRRGQIALADNPTTVPLLIRCVSVCVSVCVSMCLCVCVCVCVSVCLSACLSSAPFPRSAFPDARLLVHRVLLVHRTIPRPRFSCCHCPRNPPSEFACAGASSRDKAPMSWPRPISSLLDCSEQSRSVWSRCAHRHRSPPARKARSSHCWPTLTRSICPTQSKTSGLQSRLSIFTR